MFCRICDQRLKSFTSTTEWAGRNVHISCLKTDKSITNNNKNIILRAINHKNVNKLPEELLKLVTLTFQGKLQLFIITNH